MDSGANVAIGDNIAVQNSLEGEIDEAFITLQQQQRIGTPLSGQTTYYSVGGSTQQQFSSPATFFSCNSGDLTGTLEYFTCPVMGISSTPSSVSLVSETAIFDAVIDSDGDTVVGGESSHSDDYPSENNVPIINYPGSENDSEVTEGQLDNLFSPPSVESSLELSDPNDDDSIFLDLSSNVNTEEDVEVIISADNNSDDDDNDDDISNNSDISIESLPSHDDNSSDDGGLDPEVQAEIDTMVDFQEILIIVVSTMLQDSRQDLVDGWEDTWSWP